MVGRGRGGRRCRGEEWGGRRWGGRWGRLRGRSLEFQGNGGGCREGVGGLHGGGALFGEGEGLRMKFELFSSFVLAVFVFVLRLLLLLLLLLM